MLISDYIWMRCIIGLYKLNAAEEWMRRSLIRTQQRHFICHLCNCSSSFRLNQIGQDRWCWLSRKRPADWREWMSIHVGQDVNGFSYRLLAVQGNETTWMSPCCLPVPTQKHIRCASNQLEENKILSVLEMIFNLYTFKKNNSSHKQQLLSRCLGHK